MSYPRVPPGGRQEVGVPAYLLAKVAQRVLRTELPPNLFVTLGRHKRLFWGWLVFAGQLMPGGRLPRREAELVILRVAHLRDSVYEREHHEHLGRKAGLTSEEIARTTQPLDAPGWSARERAILLATDELVTHGDVAEAAWMALEAEVPDQRERIELCVLVGHYVMLATTIKALRIQPDPKRA